MKTLLLIAMSLALGAVWVADRLVAARLRVQVAAQREANLELTTLHRERDRLRALQPDTAELARLHRTIAERQRANAAAEAASQPSRLNTLAVGEWLPPQAWTNRGCATPATTIETMLWAAAGGDVAKLQDLLHFDEATQTKLEQIFARLPENSRTLYASPAQLLAAYTTKSIPLGAAQLVWQHQRGPDEATACVWLENQEAAAPQESAVEPRRAPLTPPMGPPNPKKHQAYLALHRTDEGWRVRVPPGALDKLAQELAPASGP